LTKETVIQPKVGIDKLVIHGEAVTPGKILCRIHASDKAHAEAALSRLRTAFRITQEPPSTVGLIRGIF